MTTQSENQERIRSALSYLSPENRDDWVKYGMCIKHEFGPEGFDLWDSWGSQSEKHSASSARSVWKSIKTDGKRTIATLIYDAKAAGWKEAGGYKKPTKEEIEARKAAAAACAKKAAEEEAIAHAQAAERAKAIWDTAAPVEGDDHPYLKRKGVSSYGLRRGVWEITREDTGEVITVSTQALLVPIRDPEGKLWSLQAIFPDEKNCLRRDKDYLKGSTKYGRFFPIGKPQQRDGHAVFVLGEGYATSASVHAATGHMVLVCFDTSNLLPVAKALRQAKPEVCIVFAADNDVETKGNPGLAKAIEAARAVDGLVAIPQLAGMPEKSCDFNDLYIAEGADAVRACMFSAAPVQPLKQVVLVSRVIDAHGVAYALQVFSRLEKFPPKIVVIPHEGRGIEWAVQHAVTEHADATSVVILADVGEEVDVQHVSGKFHRVRVEHVPPDLALNWQGWGGFYLDMLFDLLDGLVDTHLRQQVDATLQELVYRPHGISAAGHEAVTDALLLSEPGVSDHAESSKPAAHGPSEILLEPGELPRAVDLAELVLLQRAPHIYTRGGRIVRPIKVPTIVSGGKKSPITQIKSISKHALVEDLTRVVDWVKPDYRRRDDDKLARVNCPLQVAETLMARDQWCLRPLTAVIHGPTLRADGTILEDAGYDNETGLLLELHADFAKVPQNPSREDALNALARIEEIVCEFPFVNPADKAVWVSGLLTAAIRRSLPTAPMFAFTAPTAGTGKSYLADIIAIVVTGEAAPAMSQGRNEEETEKRLTGALLAGHTIINLDNCTLALDGDFLCQMLTQPVVDVRKMGGHDICRIPGSTTMLATGNSLVIAGDMTRRALVCNLDSGHERPELRQFHFNPVSKAKSGRAGYLIDVLIILRAYQVAGLPDRAKPLGSFEAWSDWVRSALMWLGMEDPCTTMERTRKSDPKLSSLREFLHLMNKVFGEHSVRAREIIEKANKQIQPSSGSSLGVKEYENPDLREVLLAVAGHGDVINNKILGKWLSGNLGRPVDGLRLVVAGHDRDGVNLWSVQSSAPPI